MVYTYKSIKKADAETKRLFSKIYKYFMTDYDYIKTNAFFDTHPLDYLNDLIKESDLFYKVFKGDVFLGCIYVNNLNIHSCEFNAFANRKLGADTYKAGACLVKHLFSTYNIEKVKAIIDKDNRPARFSLIKAGFKYECALKKETKRNGELIDRCVYSIFRGE